MFSMDNVSLGNFPIESPMNKFCYGMDKKFFGKSIYDYFEFVETLDPVYITNLLMQDFRFRYNSQLNALVEIYGQQGSGKSIFGQNLAGNIGKIYELPFDMERHTVADLDILNMVLPEAPYRTTFIADEQPLSFFGYGSTRVKKNLKDFEEISRITMKNIIYISPSSREHSSYYVFKEHMQESVQRASNEECLKCSKQKECLKLYSENKFDTLCGLPFWERHGYPVAFIFMLCTPRKTDNHLMPRGYVRFPVLPPKLMQKYDIIKGKNMELFEKKESMGWNEQREQLRAFQKKFRHKIIKEDGKIASKNLIKAYLHDHFGSRAFTTTELDIMACLVKEEIGSVGFSEDVQKEFNEERFV